MKKRRRRASVPLFYEPAPVLSAAVFTTQIVSALSASASIPRRDLNAAPATGKEKGNLKKEGKKIE